MPDSIFLFILFPFLNGSTVQRGIYVKKNKKKNIVSQLTAINPSVTLILYGRHDRKSAVKKKTFISIILWNVTKKVKGVNVTIH